MASLKNLLKISNEIQNNSQKYNHNEYYEIFGEKVIFDSQYLEIDVYILFYWNESGIRILDCNFNHIMVVDEKSNIITFGTNRQDLKDYFSKNNITNINDITEEMEFYLKLKGWI